MYWEGLSKFIESCGNFVVYLGHLRFQIAIVLALWGLVVQSRKGGPLDSLLGGLFDLTPKRAGAVAAGAGLLGLSLLTTANLVLTYGPERFGTARPAGGRFYLGVFVLHGWAAAFGAFAVVPLLWVLARVVLRSSDRRLVVALWVCGGTAVAAGVGYLGYWSASAVARWTAWLPWFLWDPRGFGIFQDGMMKLHPGHGGALGAALVTGLLYIAAGAWTGWRIKHQRRTSVQAARTLPIPALGWVLALLILLTWTLGGLAFLMDGLGISALLAAGVVLTLYHWVAKRVWIEPHTYHVYSRNSQKAASPADVLRAKWEDSDHAVAVVCASGGGIHAAAWCAHLLEELERRIPDFRSRLALTSSVSGGSVGCFYFQAAHGQNLPNGQLFRMAATSSLDFAAWGFAFRDLVRFLIPVGDWFKVGNRSWALERAWRRFMPRDDSPLARKLDQWEKETCEGKRPAAVFNATIVETGQRFPIATVDLGRVSFRGLYPHHTLRACTAANLSAAFPLVLPAASPWTEKGTIPKPIRYHLVDGGYYDNYGLVSALDFLEAGLAELDPQVRCGKTVVILRIEGHRDADAEANPGTGLLFQLRAPLKTMFGMRSASQRERNELELALAVERWAAEGVTIKCETLAYPHPGAPLSWHLTDKQKQAILAAGRVAGKELDRVAELLGRA